MLDNQTQAPHPLTADARLTLMEAIIHQRVVRARYNNNDIKLAPHQLFERAGDLYLTALNLSKVWRMPDEQRLGQFKLVGLSAVELLDETFTPLPSYDGATPRPSDVVVLAV